MNTAGRLLLLPSSLWFLAALLAVALAADTRAASWSESGNVDIRVIEAGGPSTPVGKDASNVLDTDTVDSIDVGKSGLLASQQTGTLTISGAGEVGSPRDLGDVEVKVGLLELNDAIVGSKFLRVGIVISSQFTDPSQGTLSVTLSDVSNAVTIRNGFLTCQASRMANITVDNASHAQIAGCVIEAFSSAGASESFISGSTLNVGLPNFRGNMTVSTSTITSINGTVVDGTIGIGGLPGGTDWDASGTITVGQNLLPTVMTVSGSTIESGTAHVRDGPTDLVLGGAASWRAIDLFQFQGAAVTADVRDASRIESLGDLWIGLSDVTVRSSAGDDSHIDVDGNLELGRFSAGSVTFGTLTIEDGGYVDVGGTLTIHPQATLNLNGGTLRVGTLDNQGTLNENGGTLIVPEPGAPGIAALLVLGVLARCRPMRRSRATRPAAVA